MRIHWPAVLGVLTTLAGVVTSPAVLNVLPSHWSAAITAAGAIWQAVSKAIHDGAPK